MPTTSTAELTGYQAVAFTLLWTSGQSLDSLLDNEYTDLADEIDNSTLKHFFDDLEMNLGSAAFTGTDSALEVYLVPSIDGTVYPDWVGNTVTDQQQNDQYFVGSITTTGATAAQIEMFEKIALSNQTFRYAFRNRTNVQLASSGNAIDRRPHGFQATTP